MKECYCGKLCKGLGGLEVHQRSCKVLDLPELREMFQQPLLHSLCTSPPSIQKERKVPLSFPLMERGLEHRLLLQEINESDNISDDNNSDNEPDNKDLHNSVVLKGLKLPRSKEEWHSVNTHFKINMAIQNDINKHRRNSTGISINYI